MHVMYCMHVCMYVCTYASFHQVLKIAILAEIFAPDSSWYVDTMLNLIRWAGDYVSEEVWHRVIQVIINRDDVQGYAAKTCFEVRLHLNIDNVFLTAMFQKYVISGDVRIRMYGTVE